MSSVGFGQWRCSGGRSRSLRALIAAAAVLLSPAAPFAQDNEGFVIPDIDQLSDALLMAEQAEVAARVTFVAPTGIAEVNALQIGAPNGNLADSEPVTIGTDDAIGGAKTAAAVQPGTKTAANLNVTSAPGQAITIQVGDVVATDGYTLANFRCNYNASSDRACDGQGFSEITVASGTLMVGATLVAERNGAAGPFDGSFAVTISYQ